MKRLVTAAVLAAFGTTGAYAADLGARVYTKAPVSPAFDWTGFYAGVNIGGVASGSSLTPDPSVMGTGYGLGDADDLLKSGVIGGGQIGYNWQLSPSWVFGLEGDISGMNARRSVCNIDDCFPTSPYVFSTKTDWLATARARLGYTFDRSMLYVTGGGAFAGVRDSFGTSASDMTRSGYAIGAGLETALWGNWSAKAEYLYANVGTDRVNSTLDAGAYVDFKHEYQIGRIGLNYRIGDAVTPAAASGSFFTKAPTAIASTGWDGFYAGVNIGGTGSGASVTDSSAPPIGDANTGDGLDLFKSGVIGGGQIGYNWQFAPRWVFGLEGDISGLGVNRSVCDINDCTNTPLIVSTRTDWLATARARLGYTWDRSLLYVTGGAAFAGVRDSFNEYGNLGAGSNTTRTGYAVGGGIETALWNNWSIKTEYIYANVGTDRVNSIGHAGEYLDFKHEYHIGRIGLNYKFGGPVIANY